MIRAQMPIVPAKPRARRTRDLAQAITLRPADVFALYGIPSSTLHQLCNHPDPSRRLPSMLIRGRQGQRGIRLVNHAELKAFLEGARRTAA